MGWRGPMTHRQFKAWTFWLRDQWNRPSRTDHYLMRVGYEVRCGNAGKQAGSVKMEHLKLAFIPLKKDEDPELGLTDEEHKTRTIEISKSIWLGMMTKPVKRVEES